jgi:hypothetical protein
MRQYLRSDKLCGMSTCCSYFGGNSWQDATVHLGEIAANKFYLTIEGQPSFYERSDGSWSQCELSNSLAQRFDSLKDLLTAFQVELVLETGEKVESSQQVNAPLSQELMDKFPPKSAEVESFDQFNAWRHGIAGDE